jgi:hypothetical protein
VQHQLSTKVPSGAGSQQMLVCEMPTHSKKLLLPFPPPPPDVITCHMLCCRPCCIPLALPCSLLAVHASPRAAPYRRSDSSPTSHAVALHQLPTPLSASFDDAACGPLGPLLMLQQTCLHMSKPDELAQLEAFSWLNI